MEKSNECPRGCHNYNKPVSEIVQAVAKHREAALSLKEIGEKQKKKIKEYRNTIENLKDEQQKNDEYTCKVSKENKELEKEVILLKKKLKEHDSSDEASEEENEDMLSKIDQLEEDVEIGYKIVQSKVKELEMTNKELKQVKEEKNELSDLVMEFEKKSRVANKVIESLQSGKEELKNEIKERNLHFESSESDVQKWKSRKDKELKDLLTEIETLQQNNEQKEVDLSCLKSDIDVLSRKLVIVEEEKEELKLQAVIDDQKSEDGKSLSEELGISEAKSINVESSCDPCKFVFEDGTTLTKHNEKSHEDHHVRQIFELQLQEINLGKEISKQKMKLSSDFFKLREKENDERKVCNCKGYCNIFHTKHNYKKSIIQKLQCKSGVIFIDYECEDCGKKCPSKENLKKHIETQHTNHS